MVQPQYDDDSKGNPSERFGKLAFVVGDPSDPRPAADASGRPIDSSQTGSDRECANWLNERLTACYND